MIKLNTSTVAVYSSSDYSQFRMITGNRQLDEAKIKRIKSDIMNGLDMLRFCPILVHNEKETLQIVDGQHRFWVAKTMKKPVHFIIVEKEIGLSAIAKMNSNQEKWKTEDFINCYTVLGNENYQILKDFMEKYRLPLSVCLMLLAKGKAHIESGYHGKSDFERGKFVAEHLERAEEIARTASQFSKFHKWRSRSFIVAISHLMSNDKNDVADLIEKFQANPEILEEQINYKAYIQNLETIYNHRMRSRRILYYGNETQ